MQTQLSTKTRGRHETERAAHIISSYTCPRCREWGYEQKCRRCGWTPEMTVAGLEYDEELRDSVIAC